MAKNQKLINSMLQIARRNRADQIAQASEDVTPMVYAGIALALHRECGWGFKRINRVFALSQRYWEEYENEDMIKLCEDETGILLLNRRQAEEMEIE